MVLLLITQAALLLDCALGDFVTPDEAGHIASGLVHWKTGDLRPYDVNPPLTRMIGTAPLLLLNPVVPFVPSTRSPQDRPEATLGELFALANPDTYLSFVRASRWIVIVQTLTCSVLLLEFGLTVFGKTAGLVAMAMWVFCPFALAHGHLLTADMAGATGALLSFRFFWRYDRQPTNAHAIECGLTLGLALLGKFTNVVLFPVYGVWIAIRTMTRQFPVRRATLSAMLITLGCLLVVHAGYGFPRPVTLLGDFRFVSKLLGQDPPDAEWANRFQGTWLQFAPIPFPEEMILGIDRQRGDFEQHWRSYLRGEFRYGGWWYYYLYGLAVKLPVGHLILLTLALVLAVVRFRRFADVWLVWLPGLTLLAFVSSQTGFSHHVRYCLPALPFLFLGVGGVVQGMCFLRALAALALAAVTLSAASVARNHPKEIGYFNELAGGSVEGPTHLLDSNIDWGQDLLRLSHWIQKNPQARPLNVACFHLLDPGILGITYTLPPMDVERPPPGWYVFSVNILHGYGSWFLFDGEGKRVRFTGDPYRHFRIRQPVARIGSSIVVYHVPPD